MKTGIDVDIDKTVYVARGAIIEGDKITIGKDSNIWFNSVIRTDGIQSITVGERTNIQDLTMVHVGTGYSVSIGDDVTIGHMCIIHGCKIGNNTLIGMGSTIMNGAEIGDNCIIGAGSLITEDKIIPDGSLAFGRPAKIVRELTPEEIKGNTYSAEHYVKEARDSIKSV